MTTKTGYASGTCPSVAGFDTTRDSLVKIKDKLKKHDDKMTGLVA